MRVYRSDAGWQERGKDIRADAVIVSMSTPSFPRHGCIPAEPAAVSPGKIIVPHIVIGGVILDQLLAADLVISSDARQGEKGEPCRASCLPVSVPGSGGDH
jgi:hypothetical protein